jgi:hypothetical protein
MRLIPAIQQTPRFPILRDNPYSAFAEGVGPAGAEKGDTVLGRNGVTAGSAAIAARQIAVLTAFQVDFAMLADRWVLHVAIPLRL